MDNLKSITTQEILNEFRKKYNFELYGQTIEKFFRLYEVEFWKYIVTYSKWIPMFITLGRRFKPEIKDLLFENAELIMTFHEEYYKKVYTIKEISNITKYNPSDVKVAVKKHFLDYGHSHLLVAQHFSCDVSEIHDDRQVWNITIRHIEKILSGIVPPLKKNLDDIYLQYHYSDVSTIDNKIFDFGVIGYSDYQAYLIEQLSPIIDPDDTQMWGLDFPGGILFYGPPGCGKTHWAKSISKLLNYEIVEIPRSLFGSTFVDGAMNNLKELLTKVKEKEKVILFFDEFDSIATARNGQGAASIENAKVVNTLLQEIPELIKRNILVIAASNFINQLDPAVIRPGRFDLKIPIFPPLPLERISILLDYLLKDPKTNSSLPINSPLLYILNQNGVDRIEFWDKYIDQLDLMSTSFIIDLSKNFKINIRRKFLNNHEVKLTDHFVKESISSTRSKLTVKDAEYYANFYEEIKNVDLPADLNERRKQLLKELESYYRGKENPPRPMGFRMPDVP